MVIKMFLSARGLGSAANSGLSSYSVICLLISFLQVRCTVTSPFVVQSLTYGKYFLQLGPTGLFEMFVNNPMESESLGHLLLLFFDYYGNHFPYSTSVVSVSSRSLLSKKEKGWMDLTQPDSLAIECLVRPGASLIASTDAHCRSSTIPTRKQYCESNRQDSSDTTGVS